jgi:hypothetical protein
VARVRRYAFALLLAACGGHDDAPKAPAPASAAAKPLGDLFPARPGLPTPLAGVLFSMDKAAVHAAVPALGADEQIVPAGFDDVRVHLEYAVEDQRLRYVQADLPPDSKPALVARWGAGVEAWGEGNLPATWWLNEGAGVQVVLLNREGRRVRPMFWPLSSWRAALGAHEDRLGFETTPLLGARADDVVAAYASLRPRRTPTSVELHLPPQELTTEPLPVTLALQDDRVVQVSFPLDYRHLAALADDYRAALADKLGDPAGTVDGVTYYAGKPLVRVEDEEVLHRLMVYIGP